MSKPRFIDNINAYLKSIQARVTTDEVIAYLGLKLRDADKDTPDGDHFRADCMRCKSKNALYITKSVKKYYCHCDDRGGDLVGLTAHIKKITQREAGLLLEQEVLDKPEAPLPRTPKRGRSRAKKIAQLKPTPSVYQPPAEPSPPSGYQVTYKFGW